MSRAGVVLLLAGALSCGTDATAPSGECSTETSSVALTVSSGTTPRLDWSPRCAVALVLVEVDSTGHDAWFIETPEEQWAQADANRILPPVTFGQAALPGTQTIPPAPLVPGTRYHAVILKALPTGSSLRCQQNASNACLLALKQFMP